MLAVMNFLDQRAYNFYNPGSSGSRSVTSKYQTIRRYEKGDYYVRLGYIIFDYRCCGGDFRILRNRLGRRRHREGAVLHLPDSVRGIADLRTRKKTITDQCIAEYGIAEKGWFPAWGDRLFFVCVSVTT